MPGKMVRRKATKRRLKGNYYPCGKYPLTAGGANKRPQNVFKVAACDAVFSNMALIWRLYDGAEKYQAMHQPQPHGWQHSRNGPCRIMAALGAQPQGGKPDHLLFPCSLPSPYGTGATPIRATRFDPALCARASMKRHGTRPGRWLFRYIFPVFPAIAKPV